MKQPIIAVLFLLLAALMTKPAMAEDDFTFKIPLQIHNLSEQVSVLYVRCTVRGRHSDGTVGPYLPKIVRLPLDSSDSGTGDVSISEVVVGYTLPREYGDPRDVTGYECKLWMDTRSNRDVEVSGCGSYRAYDRSNSNTYFRLGAAGAPCQVVVSGTIQ